MRATRTALPDLTSEEEKGVLGPGPSRRRILSVLGFSLPLTRVVGTLARHADPEGLGGSMERALVGLRNASMLRVGAARWLAGGLVWSFGRVGQRAPRVWCRRS